MSYKLGTIRPLHGLFPSEAKTLAVPKATAGAAAGDAAGAAAAAAFGSSRFSQPDTKESSSLRRTSMTSSTFAAELDDVTASRLRSASRGKGTGSGFDAVGSVACLHGCKSLHGHGPCQSKSHLDCLNNGFAAPSPSNALSIVAN